MGNLSLNKGHTRTTISFALWVALYRTLQHLPSPKKNNTIHIVHLSSSSSSSSSSLPALLLHIFSSTTNCRRMPRSAGVQERAKRWDNSESAKFQEQVNSGIINIDNVNPTTIETIWTNHGWSYRTRENFRTNYKWVAAKLRIARDYNGARAATADLEEDEESKIFLCMNMLYSASPISLVLLLFLLILSFL